MSLVRARELYIKVICNVIVYRMSAWHMPIKGGQPRRLAKALLTTQSECLHTVTGIYKTTPIHYLKREMDVLSVDIYFNKKIADFERRLVKSGMTELINNSNTTITIYLYNRHPHRHLKETHPETRSTKVE